MKQSLLDLNIPIYKAHSGAVIIYRRDVSPNKLWDLFHLTDYVVSSVSDELYWLVVRS